MTNLERCLAYLATLPPAVSGSGGHNATLRAACECVRFGLTDSEAMQALGEFNRRCQPAWSEHELAHKLASARKLALGEVGHRCRGGNSRRGGSARTFDRCALERHLARHQHAVPPMPAPIATPPIAGLRGADGVATHPADAMRAAAALAEKSPAWLCGVAIVGQPVDVQEVYWAEVWRRLGMADPGLVSVPGCHP